MAKGNVPSCGPFRRLEIDRVSLADKQDTGGEEMVTTVRSLGLMEAVVVGVAFLQPLFNLLNCPSARQVPVPDVAGDAVCIVTV